MKKIYMEIIYYKAGKCLSETKSIDFNTSFSFTPPSNIIIKEIKILGEKK
jgi:hypothetical protein